MISAGVSSNSIISVLIPAVVGAVLGFAGALFLRRGEHRWQQARENNQRDWEEKREKNQRAWAEARESQQRDLEEQRERHDREWQEQREVQAREWQAEQQRLAHEREVAWQKQRDWFIAVTEVIPSLDAALLAAQRFVEGRDDPGERTRWDAAYREWQDAWVTYSPHLGDDDLEARYQAVGSTLVQLGLHGDHDSVGMSALVNVAVRAIINARIALAYTRRRDPLPSGVVPIERRAGASSRAVGRSGTETGRLTGARAAVGLPASRGDVRRGWYSCG
jgi:hypothetical protein